MISREYLGFCLTLSQVLAVIISTIQHVLAGLSYATLYYILLFYSVAITMLTVVLIFRAQTKKDPNYKLGHVKIPPWIPPSIFCFALAALLLLQVPC